MTRPTRRLRFVRCDWYPGQTPDGRPAGERCGAPATHRIIWLDSTNRYSHGCGGHLELPEAPPHRIEPLDDRRAFRHNPETTS